MQILKKWQLFLSVLALSACGGGGGSSSASKTNQPPTVNITGPSQMESGAIISLSANASDADGSIATYSWVTESDAIMLVDTKSATLTVVAGNVSVETTVKLTLTVTDNQGASTQSNLQIKIAVKKTSLAINGLVTDALVPNANVSATVRDLTFTTTADANGKYTLNLSVDDAHLNDLVLITADGGLSKPVLKLVSQLPSMNTLVVQAGGDKQLDASENFSVNVTNVTTAEYGLMVRRRNSYGISFANINNDLQLTNTADSVGVQRKYWLAALIKIVADMGGSLPAGAKTTLDLAMNGDLADELSSSIIINSGRTLIEDVIASIKKDSSVVTPQSLDYTGTYILYDGFGDSDWLLSFNDNNKGEARSRFGMQSFTWGQSDNKLTINFDKPLDLQRPDFLGSWFATSIEIFVDQQFGSTMFTSMWMYEAKLDGGGQTLSNNSRWMGAKMASVAKSLSLEKENLVGKWIQGTDGSARLFKLNSDGSVNSSRLDGTDAQLGLTWSLGNKGFTVYRDGKKLTDYYLLYDLGAHYSFAAMDWSPTSDEVTVYAWEGKLIKPQQLFVAKADLRGTYIGADGRIFTLSNDDIIETGTSQRWPWNFFSTDNSWATYTYQDKSSVWLSYCDESANKSCKVSRSTVNKIFASANDSYYLLKSQTTYGPDGKQVSTQDWLETWTRIPTPSYFDYWFDRSTYRREFFQQTAAGVKVWHFRSGVMEIDDRSEISSVFHKFTIPTIVEKGKLRYVRDGAEKLLELISVSDEGIVVCEYNVGASCTKGTEITLSNRTPAAINYKVSAGGSVEYASSYASDSDPMTLFGNVATFTIVPDQGYTIESVTGCGGKLQGFTYKTAAVRDKCTITANFVKTSVQ